MVVLICSACTSGTHRKLAPQSVGVNIHYYPYAEPTKSQKEAGTRALFRWKNADQNERYWLADEIVAGKTLIGLSEKDVEDYLGSSVPVYESKSDTDFPSEGLMGCISKYNAMPVFPTRESTCELCAKYDKNGRVEKSYIDVNE